MSKPMSEHSTTFKARKQASAPAPIAHDEHLLEPVGGKGHVRRVEFELHSDDPHRVTRQVPTGPPARQVQFRHNDSIDDIHFEIDNIHRIKRGAPPRAREPRERVSTEKVYETRGGGVKSARMETTRGEKRVLYTSRTRGGHEEDTRFHSGLVDRIIAERYKGGPQFEAADDAEAKKGLFGRKAAPVEGEVEVVKRGVKPKKAKTTKKAKATKKAKTSSTSETTVTTSKVVTKTKPAKKAKATKPAKAKKAKATPTKVVATTDDDYQPQCGAVTRDGLQCRNSCKESSEYCGAHQAYTPRSIDDLLDTKPARGADTKPGVGDSTGTGQCAAYTKEGLQCRNNSRGGSKYCGSHKSYRAPSKASLSKAIDTEPRWKKAKDTVPKVK